SSPHGFHEFCCARLRKREYCGQCAASSHAAAVNTPGRGSWFPTPRRPPTRLASARDAARSASVAGDASFADGATASTAPDAGRSALAPDLVRRSLTVAIPVTTTLSSLSVDTLSTKS